MDSISGPPSSTHHHVHDPPSCRVVLAFRISLNHPQLMTTSPARICLSPPPPHQTIHENEWVNKSTEVFIVYWKLIKIDRQRWRRKFQISFGQKNPLVLQPVCSSWMRWWTYNTYNKHLEAMIRRRMFGGWIDDGSVRVNVFLNYTQRSVQIYTTPNSCVRGRQIEDDDGGNK